MLLRVLISFAVLAGPISHAETGVFQHRMEHAYTVPQTQIFKPYITQGPDELLDLELVQWIPIDGENYPEGNTLEDNVVGLTAEGRVYHTIQVEGHNYARLLSGHRCISEIQLLNSEPQVLLAEACDGQILLYDSSVWHKTLGLKVFLGKSLETVVLGGLTYLLVGLVAQHTGEAHSPELVRFLERALLGLSGASLLITQTLTGFLRFEKLNNWPDGFKAASTDAKALGGGLTRYQIANLFEQASPDADDWQISCSKVLKYHMDRDLF
ncbi:MAG: hypothetical protein HRT45_00030 [Bdellovibrionales bacterium]|nr:hypothetical protein [Bdellovibrionales bacterium]